MNETSLFQILDAVAELAALPDPSSCHFQKSPMGPWYLPSNIDVEGLRMTDKCLLWIINITLAI